jgi:CheY-like chemotaxis protein
VVPDLALLDIGLPVMDGYELARRLRKLPGWEHVPLVAVTGYGQERDKQLARDAGFDKHLVKPLNLATLKKTLAETMKPSAYAAGSSGSVK